jgi:hypothetical protein
LAAVVVGRFLRALEGPRLTERGGHRGRVFPHSARAVHQRLEVLGGHPQPGHEDPQRGNLLRVDRVDPVLNQERYKPRREGARLLIGKVVDLRFRGGAHFAKNLAGPRLVARDPRQERVVRTDERVQDVGAVEVEPAAHAHRPR